MEMPRVQGDELYRLFHFFLLSDRARCNDKQGKEEDSVHDVGKIKLNKKLIFSYNFSFKRVEEFYDSNKFRMRLRRVFVFLVNVVTLRCRTFAIDNAGSQRTRSGHEGHKERNELILRKSA